MPISTILVCLNAQEMDAGFSDHHASSCWMESQLSPKQLRPGPPCHICFYSLWLALNIWNQGQTATVIDDTCQETKRTADILYMCLRVYACLYAWMVMDAHNTLFAPD